MIETILLNLDEAADDSVLVEGDVLAEDLLDGSGMPIIKKDSALSGVVLAKLKKRGIQTIKVLRIVRMTDEQRQQRRAEIRRQLDSRFQNVADNELMLELKQSLYDYKSKDL